LNGNQQGHGNADRNRTFGYHPINNQAVVEEHMFFEFRQYRIKDGRRDEWVKFMEEEIIPFQISKGMVVAGSFVGEQEPDLYVWIRRFDSEEERVQLYKAVYESDHWVNVLKPRIDTMLDRPRIVVTRLNPTPKSILR
jgi:NIPSNAP